MVFVIANSVAVLIGELVDERSAREKAHARRTDAVDHAEPPAERENELGAHRVKLRGEVGLENVVSAPRADRCRAEAFSQDAQHRADQKARTGAVTNFRPEPSGSEERFFSVSAAEVRRDVEPAQLDVVDHATPRSWR
jgi:hypothetical protein